MANRHFYLSHHQVRAALDGRLSQTRRVLRPQPSVRPEFYEPMSDEAGYWAVFDGDEVAHRVRIPYALGDRLWVREAWHTAIVYDDLKPSDMGGDEPIRYDADGAWQTWGWGEPLRTYGRKRPGMFMPRWASRITLLVTDVRVQRLQEISEEDAMAEGIHRNLSNWFPIPGVDGSGTTARAAFAGLWNNIHGPGAWDANPWVSAITFDVHRDNIDAVSQ